MSDERPSEGCVREITNESIVEAILFAADGPLPAARIAHILGSGTASEVKEHVEGLNGRYEREGAAFRIEAVANGYRMLTLPVYHRWIENLTRCRHEARLSQAAMETLAIVAYKQPVLRAEIEAIRGVTVGDVLNRLRELNLVRIVGRAEEIGRPMLYGTTRKFLEVFGLDSLEGLPQVEALTPPGQPPVTSREPTVEQPPAHERLTPPTSPSAEEGEGRRGPGVAADAEASLMIEEQSASLEPPDGAAVAGVEAGDSR